MGQGEMPSFAYHVKLFFVCKAILTQAGQGCFQLSGKQRKAVLSSQASRARLFSALGQAGQGSSSCSLCAGLRFVCPGEGRR
eukprot:51588-Chlamydomonas_euryale.AAC.1